MTSAATRTTRRRSRLSRLSGARPPIRVVGVLALLLVAVLAGTASATAAPAAGAATGAATGARGASVVVLGVAGLRWDDLSPARTPVLWALVDRGAVGSLVVRGTASRTCPAEGWLALGTGRRSRVSPSPRRCADLPPIAPAGVGAGEVSTWDDIVAVNARGTYDAKPGWLGDLLAHASVASLAVGPGAALTLATSGGRVPAYVGAVDDMPSHSGVSNSTAARLTVVDLGTTQPLVGGARDPGSVDRAAAAALARVPTGATVLLAGVSDEFAAGQAHLRVAAAAGPGFPADRWLTSSSTRRPHLMTMTDLAPTVLTLLGVAVPPDAIGQPWRAGGVRPETAAAARGLVGYDDKVRTVAASRKNFFTFLVLSQLLLYATAALGLRRRWGGQAARLRVLAATRRASVGFAAVPVATFLANIAPWWDSPAPGATIALLVAVIVLAITAVALWAGSWTGAAHGSLLGPIGLVAGVTFVVLAADMVLGGRLEEASLMGYFPPDGGRFYGFGNVAFSIFATGAVLFATVVAAQLTRRGQGTLALAATIAVALATVLVDGAPFWGDDVGGVLALVPGFLVLGMGVAGIAVTWRRLALALVAGAAVLVVVALADWQGLLGGRTHLGRFVQQVLDGEGGTVLRRKARANLRVLLTWLGLIVPAAVAFVMLVLRRPGGWHPSALSRLQAREPMLRAGFVALAVTMAVGFAFNDSGITIPAVALTIAVPLLLAACVRALELDEEPHKEPE